MPVSFDRFRYLNDDEDGPVTPHNQPARKIDSITYRVYLDPLADDTKMVFEDTDGTDLDKGSFRTKELPIAMPGIQSVKIVKLAMEVLGNPHPATVHEIEDWVLVSPYEDYADIVAVEVVVDRPDQDGYPDVYRATARLFYSDEYYSETFRFF